MRPLSVSRCHCNYVHGAATVYAMCHKAMFVLALPSHLYEATFNQQTLLQHCGVGNVCKLPLRSLEVCLCKRKEAEGVCLFHCTHFNNI